MLNEILKQIFARLKFQFFCTFVSNVQSKLNWIWKGEFSKVSAQIQSRWVFLFFNSRNAKSPKHWAAVSEIQSPTGEFKFRKLSQLANACLCISHGNAGPERGFSLNKNVLDDRHSLGEETIEALRLVKEAVLLYGGVTKFPINRMLLTYARNAHSAFLNFLEMQKESKKKLEKEKLPEAKGLSPEEQLHSIEMEHAEEEKKSGLWSHYRREGIDRHCTDVHNKTQQRRRYKGEHDHRNRNGKCQNRRKSYRRVEQEKDWTSQK